jgi:hypothetical protein
MDNLSRNAIALKKINAIVVSTGNEDNAELATAFQANLMRLGFILNVDAFEAVRTLSETTMRRLHDRVISTLRAIKGDNVRYEPMYPNFPQQVAEASDIELLFNAFIHYWTYGTLVPYYKKAERPYAFEDVKFREIGLATEEDFLNIVPTILSSADSISEEDREIVKAILTNERNVPVPETIPFAENRVFYGSILFENGIYDLDFIETTTDVLRLATALSDGDVSLAENTRFRNFRRPERRALVNALERVINEEDLARHRGKWIRLFHALHVGDYSERLWKIAKKVRNNETIETFNGKVETALANGETIVAATLLAQRPGEFARRILSVLSLKGVTKTRLQVIEMFADVIDRVPTRNLLQLRGMVHARGRGDVDLRVAFPKGSTQNAIAIRDQRRRLAPSVYKDLSTAIDASLLKRFGDLDTLGNVWIDPRLDECPLPTQQRSASVSEWSVARGTQLPLGDKNFLRLFIYWVGNDIDLSATFHDENFEERAHISYTALRNGTLRAWHSGDITYAPDGASEFIDVDINGALAAGVRYVVMNVYVFSGPNFSEHKSVYAGWMTRDKPHSNEIYEPATVQQKIDLQQQSRNAIPVVFDLQERRAIWVDLTTSSRYHNWGNNVESNRATTQEILESIVNATATRTSLWDLFAIHATARGTIVADREEADVTFGFDRETDITPYDINAINADYVVG